MSLWLRNFIVSFEHLLFLMLVLIKEFCGDTYIIFGELLKVFIFILS